MKLRRNNVKREHSVIKNLVVILEQITKHPKVKGIIPGRIKPIRGSYPNAIVEFKVFTDSGIKCLAKSDRAVQEVFIICTEPEGTLKELQSAGLIKVQTSKNKDQSPK